MANDQGFPDDIDSHRSSNSSARFLSIHDLHTYSIGSQDSATRTSNPSSNIDRSDAFVSAFPRYCEPLAQTAGRLILVANRLPVTVKRRNDGGYDFCPSSGGLASGLAGVLKKVDLLWYGWPGISVPAEDEEHITQLCKDEHDCIPIFLSEEVSEAHYNGFSNSILWPLFHYHPEGVNFDESAWNGYCEANQVFADAVAPSLQDNDVLWVQDYHLMLLPELVRKALDKQDSPPQNVKIGFFLHTPFPSSEIFRVLPVRERLLEGVLACDLVGFHTPDYARHFISSCARVLNLPTLPSGVRFQNRLVEVKDHPIGIDPKHFYRRLDEPDMVRRIASLKKRFEGVKVIVGVDRLDYIKGVQQKLHALEVFLTQHEEWRGKVVLIQVAVPTRGDVEEYQNLRSVVNELVGRINGKFGTVEFTPIHFMHRSIDNDELITLYAASDICLVTSTRDGMNLVSYEFVACQRGRHGALILSEFAGAAQHLTGALIVNPWDAEMTAEALHQAVTLTNNQRNQRFSSMAMVVDKKTSEHWGTTFVRDVVRLIRRQELELKARGRMSDLGSEGEEPFDSKIASDASDGGEAKDGEAEAGSEK